MTANLKLYRTLPVIALAALLSACAKEDTAPQPTPVNPASKGSFHYTQEGGSHVTADSAFFIPAFTNIVAYKGDAYVDIILSSLSPGSYTISPTSGNTLEYSDGSKIFKGTAGSVSISSNNGTSLTGTLSVSLDNNGRSLTADFTGLTKR